MIFDILDALTFIRKNIPLAIPDKAIDTVEEYYNDFLHPTIVLNYFNDFLDDMQERIETQGKQPTFGEIALTYALAEYKKNVKERPKGSNTSPEIRMYQEFKDWLYKKPWCGSFVTWCCYMACKDLGWKRFFDQLTGAAVINLYKWGINHNCCFDARNGIPKPGDIFLMLSDNLRSGIHTGFVLEVQGNSIITIEGNYADRIARCKRPVHGAISFYLRLDKSVNTGKETL